MRKWIAVEDEDSWQLFLDPDSENPLPRHPLQVLKVPKHSTPFAEYWPSAKESAFIVEALNAAEKTRV